MKKCRNCKHWQYTGQWTGNCKLHPWPKDKFSEDADPYPSRCEDYVDKYAEPVAAAKER